MRAENFVNNDSGVIGLSCLVSFDRFDIINSFGLDYMHCVLLGVTRKLFDFYLHPNNHHETFYVKKNKQSELNRLLLSIKPNREVTRRPRSLRQRANYKASEIRSILLFYFPMLLPNILADVYVQHFRLFSSAVYLLSKSRISRIELNVARGKLEQFVRDFQNMFGQKEMVMNVHLLTHIAKCVEVSGPLWAQSAFPFERNNGCLLKFVNGTTDVLDQISSRYVIWKGLQDTNEKKIQILVSREK